MSSIPNQPQQETRGTFRFINVKAGTDSHRSMEVVHGGLVTMTDLHANTTEEETRAQLVADGYVEIDRDGNPVDMCHTILQNEMARAIVDDAIAKLAAIGVVAVNQPIISPVDASAGWFLIAAKDDAEVNSLRALLTAGCDACGSDHSAYLKALDMLRLMRE